MMKKYRFVGVPFENLACHGMLDAMHDGRWSVMIVDTFVSLMRTRRLGAGDTERTASLRVEAFE